MGSSSNFPIMVLVIAIAAIVPMTTLAKEYIVGDASGWTIGIDYQAWARGKEFRVGDKLVFQYPKGEHNVFKVNATGFQNCIIPPENEALTSGNDTITLALPGPKWYLCGVGNHCMIGQKLAITVRPAGEAPGPYWSRAQAPRGYAGSYSSGASKSRGICLASFGVAAFALVTFGLF